MASAGRTTPPPRAVRLRPSVALLRAAVVLVLAGVLAVLSHRVELLVLAAPFAVWCALGVVRRPTEPAVPTERLSARRLAVGDAVEYVVEVPGTDSVLALHVPRPPRCDVEPALGGVVARGRAVVAVRPQRWGRHVVSAEEASITDSWGMWTGFWKPQDLTVTVAPGLDTPGGGDSIPHPIGLVGIHPSRARGDGSSLAEIREFQSGDRLKRINWKVTSRTGRLHSNATTAERDTEVLIVTDTLADITVGPSGRNQSRVEGGSSLDITVGAAATISDHYIRLGDRVGLHDLGYVIGPVRAGAGARQRAIITDQLARGSAERIGMSSFRRVGRVRPGSLVVCCTPLLNADVIDEVLRLMHRGVAVIVIDTLPPELGKINTLAGSSSRAGAMIERLGQRMRNERYWTEAWALRRIERDSDLKKLERLGVPVVAWEGIGSLATVVSALAASRTAPRMARH
ncbi:DUF58 domain-containing protein [Propionibacteriaceae bacterium Y2011]|uniref:DUF58 domain-containing protein n=1 Tax=Microlunatus sp. Y2014 TaxID=3418488 RepID=UPI003B4EC934